MEAFVQVESLAKPAGSFVPEFSLCGGQPEVENGFGVPRLLFQDFRPLLVGLFIASLPDVGDSEVVASGQIRGVGADGSFEGANGRFPLLQSHQSQAAIVGKMRIDNIEFVFQLIEEGEGTLHLSTVHKSKRHMVGGKSILWILL